MVRCPILLPVNKVSCCLHPVPCVTRLLYLRSKLSPFGPYTDKVDKAKVTLEASFKEIGLDSLDTVEMVMSIEEEFMVLKYF